VGCRQGQRCGRAAVQWLRGSAVASRHGPPGPGVRGGIVQVGWLTSYTGAVRLAGRTVADMAAGQVGQCHAHAIVTVRPRRTKVAGRCKAVMAAAGVAVQVVLGVGKRWQPAARMRRTGVAGSASARQAVGNG